MDVGSYKPVLNRSLVKSAESSYKPRLLYKIYGN